VRMRKWTSHCERQIGIAHLNDVHRQRGDELSNRWQILLSLFEGCDRRCHDTAHRGGADVNQRGHKGHAGICRYGDGWLWCRFIITFRRDALFALIRPQWRYICDVHSIIAPLTAHVLFGNQKERAYAFKSL